MAPSVRKGEHKSPVTNCVDLASSKHKIPFYVPLNDDEKINEQNIQNKIIVCTFHQAKGRERKVAIIFNFVSLTS